MRQVKSVVTLYRKCLNKGLHGGITRDYFKESFRFKKIHKLLLNGITMERI